MEVRVLAAPPSSICPDQDYIRIHTDLDPLDDTAVLTTIERVTDKTKAGATQKRVKTLVTRLRMSAHAALELATSYAHWKKVPVVYADSSVAPPR
jgi:hypothetical protein